MAFITACAPSDGRRAVKVLHAWRRAALLFQLATDALGLHVSMRKSRPRPASELIMYVTKHPIPVDMKTPMTTNCVTVKQTKSRSKPSRMKAAEACRRRLLCV